MIQNKNQINQNIKLTQICYKTANTEQAILSFLINSNKYNAEEK